MDRKKHKEHKGRTALAEAMRDTPNFILVYRIHFLFYIQNACWIIFPNMCNEKLVLCENCTRLRQKRRFPPNEFILSGMKSLPWKPSGFSVTANHWSLKDSTSNVDVEIYSKPVPQMIENHKCPSWGFCGCVTPPGTWTQNPPRTHWLSSTLFSELPLTAGHLG